MSQNRQMNPCENIGTSRRRLATNILFACALIFGVCNSAYGQQKSATRSANPAPAKPVPADVMLRIVRAEDERRWDNELGILLFDKEPRVRERAALATGRIGDERSVASLISLVQTDREASVRAIAAFALGETESATATIALSEVAQKSKETSEVRARAIEALGKIIAAMPKTEEARSRVLGDLVLKSLENELDRSPKPGRDTVLLGLTAVLRARPSNAGPVVAKFLSSTDARIRADAANTLARLRAKEANVQLRALLATDADAVVRANAARALGAAEDAGSFDTFVERVGADSDERVRISAIRALGSLKDPRATVPLLERAAALTPAYRSAKVNGIAHPREINELLEIATSLGRVLTNTNDARATTWLRTIRETETSASEIEIAFARIAPFVYLREKPFNKLSDERIRSQLMREWRRVSALAQGVAELPGITAAAAGSGIVGLQADAQITLRSWLDDPNLPALAAPDVLNALAAFKPGDLEQVLRKLLGAKDVIVRGTAAGLLGDLAPNDTNTRTLAEALPVTARDELNDAALSILDSLAKQKSTVANEAIKTMLGSQDHLIRRRAAVHLKANGAGDFSEQIAIIVARNTPADYARALSRLGKNVRAVVSTDKGPFTIELLSDEAPLNVDNFVQLVQRGYFNNITFHRVVPNFVVQGGDPRGEGNGGPGYQIRCEINQVPYDRGAVGMALSGKDTGGSQWFVTHSPQPHLDGGYTVFGRVIAGMDVVDRIVRGDVIRSISVTESSLPASKTEKTPSKDSRKKRTGNP